MPRAIYDRIGRSYSASREADPRIASAINAALDGSRSVVNVGAGSGSYEPTDRVVVAVEPSLAMIAQRTLTAAPAVLGVAESLPFPDRCFDAALAVLTIHHWHDLEQGLIEMRRVARAVAVLMFDPDLMADFWLARDYFPGAAALDRRGPDVARVARALDTADVRVVPIPHDCRDGFMGAYWRRPEAYLESEVRAGISALARLRDAELHAGLTRLGKDLASGSWYERHAPLLASTEADLGYRLVVAPAGPG